VPTHELPLPGRAAVEEPTAATGDPTNLGRMLSGRCRTAWANACLPPLSTIIRGTARLVHSEASVKITATDGAETRRSQGDPRGSGDKVRVTKLMASASTPVMEVEFASPVALAEPWNGDRRLRINAGLTPPQDDFVPSRAFGVRLKRRARFLALDIFTRHSRSGTATPVNGVAQRFDAVTFWSGRWDSSPRLSLLPRVRLSGGKSAV